MSADVIIRPAQFEDIGAMVELISLLFSVEEDFAVDTVKQRRGLEMFLEYPNGRYLIVAEQQQQVIGMCSAQMLLSTAEGGWKVIVEDVVVAERFRGLGIGKKMLDALTEWAMRQNVKRMDLLADSDNSKALTFYDHLKWKRTNLIVLQKRIEIDNIHGNCV